MFMCRLDREKKDTIFLTAWTLIPLTSTVFMLISVLASSAFSKQTIAYMSRQKKKKKKITGNKSVKKEMNKTRPQ